MSLSQHCTQNVFLLIVRRSVTWLFTEGLRVRWFYIFTVRLCSVSMEPNLEEAFYLNELAEEANWLMQIRATTLR